jgi:hypothetical protein
MFSTLKKGMLTLSQDEKLHGTLPPGFLYCGCVIPSEPYKGVVRFSGFAPNEASGKCDTCGNIHTIFSTTGNKLNHAMGRYLVS